VALSQSLDIKGETAINLSGFELKLSNSKISVNINLEKGVYNVTDNIDNVVVFENARLSADGWNSSHNLLPRYAYQQLSGEVYIINISMPVLYIRRMIELSTFL
jgi:hypothetical protein